MKYVSFLCVLFSELLSTVALGEPDRYSHVATQAEVEQDSFLRGTARNLEKSDVVLSVIIYKIVSTDQGTTHYARVVQSLRGDIPVEALVKWGFLQPGRPRQIFSDDGERPGPCHEKAPAYRACKNHRRIGSSSFQTGIRQVTRFYLPASTSFDSSPFMKYERGFFVEEVHSPLFRGML